ncbi:MAG: hydroxyethylthiazole kinase [Desulfovibrio sp.]|nr:hydroxyethylthiazole kinase [Desulfovibrio sp.]
MAEDSKGKLVKNPVLCQPDAVLAGILEACRERRPRIHCITNYVTVNDVAQMTLAAGGSPVMTDEPFEAEDIVLLCQALACNIGTPSERMLDAMLRAGKGANRAGIPVVLDPVGAGASAFRNRVLATLLKQVRFAVIKGNASEIKYLASGVGAAAGVDVAEGDRITADNAGSFADLASRLAEKTGAAIVVTGPVDVVAHPDTGRFAVHSGTPAMGRVSGTGCMGTAVLAAFAGASSDRSMGEVALAGICAMDMAGEKAETRLGAEACPMPGGAPGSFRMHLLDAMASLSEEELRRARITAI